MFCIKCGMMLNDSAKSCPACGTKVVLPEGFAPEQSFVQPEPVVSSEPPHAPDDFDLSKANIVYNGQTMLITDEPEIDLDITISAPVPKMSAPVASEPVSRQPVYAPPVNAAPAYSPEVTESAPVQAVAVTESDKNPAKSKTPVIIAVSAIVLALIIVAAVLVIHFGKLKNNADDSVSTSGISENIKATLPADSDENQNKLNPDADCVIVQSVGQVTHYVVLNPASSDYSKIQKTVDILVKNGEFDKIFDLPSDSIRAEETDASFTCLYPSNTSVAFIQAGKLIFSNLSVKEVNYRSIEDVEDIIDEVAQAEDNCIAFVSCSSLPERTDVEFISLNVDQIVIACDKDNSDLNIEDSKIGIIKDSVAFRFADENNYENMPFSKKQVIVYSNEKELVEALENGEIGCVLTTADHVAQITLSKPQSKPGDETVTEVTTTANHVEDDKKEETTKHAETTVTSPSETESVSAETSTQLSQKSDKNSNTN